MNLARRLIGVLLFFALWQLVATVTAGDQLPFPSIAQTFAAVQDQRAEFAYSAAMTAARVLIGLTAGLVAAYALFGVCFVIPPIYEVIETTVEIIRPIPPVALTPFFILWLGIGSLGQVAMVALGAFMVLFVGLVQAERELPLPIVRAAQLFSSSRGRRLLAIVLPATLPAMIAPLRIAIATSFALSVAAEFLGAQGGLGYLIRNARTILQLDAVLAAALILGVLAATFDLAARAIMSAFTRWAER